MKPRVLWPALGLGLAADLLFQVEAVGLNLPLWVSAVVLSWYLLRLRAGVAPVGAERGLLLAGLALAFGLLWRESPMLWFLDVVALGGVFTLLGVSVLDPGFRLASLSAAGFIEAAGRQAARQALGLLPPLVEESRVRHAAPGGSRVPWRAVARGALLTIPPVLLFGALLGSADPAYGDFLRRIVAVDPELLAEHTVRTLFFGWVAAGLLAVLALRERPDPLLRPTPGGLGAVEVGMVLGVLDLLFLGFVVFQLPYLFGGATTVQSLQSLTYAEYARRGFFELVVVSALVLPLLLVLHSRLSPASTAGPAVFRVLGLAQIGLVFIIMSSAAHRMILYQLAYGLTADRFFASAAMAGLAVTCGWFAVTVVRGAWHRFFSGTLLAWAVWLAALHVVNPEQVIVRTNFHRAETGQALDTAYLARLSADAVPAIVAGLARLPAAEAEALRAALREQWRKRLQQPDSWTAWHPARARARELIEGLDGSRSPGVAMTPDHIVPPVPGGRDPP